MSSSCSTCIDPSQAVAAPPPPANADSPHWAAVGSLALGVFGLVTAEFLPASLLTAMATDLGISNGAAGQTVTATALVGAVAAPAFPLLTRRLDRKWVMLALSLLLVVSNLMAATATSLTVQPSALFKSEPIPRGSPPVLVEEQPRASCAAANKPNPRKREPRASPVRFISCAMVIGLRSGNLHAEREKRYF